MLDEHVPFERRKIAPADEHLDWVRERRERQVQLVDGILGCSCFASYEEAERERIRQVARAAFAELNARERAAAYLSERVMAAIFVVLGVGVAAVSLARSGAQFLSTSWWFALFRPLIALIWAVLLFGSLLYLWQRRKQRTGSDASSSAASQAVSMRKMPALGLLSVIVLVLALSVIPIMIFAAPGWNSTALSGLVLAVIWVLGGSLLAAIFATIAWRLIRTDPRAIIICQLVELTAMTGSIETAPRLESFMERWRSARNPQVELAYLLNEAARGAEKRFSSISPRGLGYGRDFLRGQGARIAAGFRVHAQLVLLNGWEYREPRLLLALASSLKSAAFGDWEELATTAPISLSKRLVANLARFAIASLLLVTAFIAPQQIAGGAYVPELRGVLLAAAALVLAAPKEAAGKLADKATDLLFPQK